MDSGGPSKDPFVDRRLIYARVFNHINKLGGDLISVTMLTKGLSFTKCTCDMLLTNEAHQIASKYKILNPKSSPKTLNKCLSAHLPNLVLRDTHTAQELQLALHVLR